MAGAMHLSMHGELGKPIERCEHAPRIGAGARQAYAVRNVRQFDNHHRNALVAPQPRSAKRCAVHGVSLMVRRQVHPIASGHQLAQVQKHRLVNDVQGLWTAEDVLHPLLLDGRRVLDFQRDNRRPVLGWPKQPLREDDCGPHGGVVHVIDHVAAGVARTTRLGRCGFF